MEEIDATLDAGKSGSIINFAVQGLVFKLKQSLKAYPEKNS